MRCARSTKLLSTISDIIFLQRYQRWRAFFFFSSFSPFFSERNLVFWRRPMFKDWKQVSDCPRFKKLSNRVSASSLLCGNVFRVTFSSSIWRFHYVASCINLSWLPKHFVRISEPNIVSLSKNWRPKCLYMEDCWSMDVSITNVIAN